MTNVDTAPESPLSPPTTRPAPRRGLLSLIAFIAALGFGGYVLGNWIGHGMRSAASDHLTLSGGERLALLFVVLTAMLFVLLAHELGHLLAGRLVGFRAFLLIVGPMRLERGARGWRVHLNRNLGLAGGMAGTAPTDAIRLRQRAAVMVAGGPFTSLVLGIGSLVAFTQMGPLPVGADSSLTSAATWFALLAIGGMSTAIGFGTLVPARTSGYLTDGAQLRLLWRGGPQSERHAAIQAIIGASLGGLRPREWSPDLIAAAGAYSDGSLMDVVAWQLAQSHAADTGRTRDAQQWLERVLQHSDRLPPTMRVAVHYDAARQLAMWGSIDAARALLASTTGPALGAAFLRPLAEAALSIADGNIDAARRSIVEARRTIDDGVDRGSTSMYHDVADALDERIRLLASGT